MAKAAPVVPALVLVGMLAGGCSVAPPAPPPDGIVAEEPATAPSPPAAPTLPTVLTPTTPPRATAAPSATPTATPTGTPIPAATAIPDVAVELAEALLTERVNAALVGQPLAETPFGTATVSSLSVRLADGSIILTGEAQAGWVRLPVASSATVDVTAGRPGVLLGDVVVGGVVVPEPVRLAMQQVLQDEVDRALAREGFRVRTVTVEDGKLTVRGRPLGEP
jgi:hypothetical protein